MKEDLEKCVWKSDELNEIELCRDCQGYDLGCSCYVSMGDIKNADEESRKILKKYYRRKIKNEK